MENKITLLLAEIMEDASGINAWNRDTKLIEEIGIDSLQLVNLLLKLEETLDITIDYEALTYEDLETIGSLESFLKKQ